MRSGKRWLERVRGLLAEDPETRGRASVLLPYRTDVFWCESLTRRAGRERFRPRAGLKAVTQTRNGRGVEVGARRMTLVRALKLGCWEAGSMAHQLDGDLLPDECPFDGVSSRRVWEGLRELQFAYQERDPGWCGIPREFERLARALPSLVALGA